MASAKAAVVTGERKAGTNIRSRAGDLAAASLKASIRWPGKTVSGEQTGETSRRSRFAQLNAVHAGGERAGNRRSRASGGGDALSMYTRCFLRKVVLHPGSAN